MTKGEKVLPLPVFISDVNIITQLIQFKSIRIVAYTDRATIPNQQRQPSFFYLKEIQGIVYSRFLLLFCVFFPLQIMFPACIMCKNDMLQHNSN